jgi:hypothetical protein
MLNSITIARPTRGGDDFDGTPNAPALVWARSDPVSCDGNRILPLGGCFGSEDPKCGPRDEMSFGHPEYVKACCERSLQLLETDVIDLFTISIVSIRPFPIEHSEPAVTCGSTAASSATRSPLIISGCVLL